MKKTLFLFTLGFLLLSFVACNGSKKPQSNTTETPSTNFKPPPKTPKIKYDKTIIIGSGGGITGGYTTYKIAPNGQLTLTQTHPNKTQGLRILTAEEMKKIHAAFNQLNFESLNINQPGNMTYLLEMQTLDGKKQELKWGNVNFKVPANVQAFYTNTLQVITKLADK